MIDEVFIDGTQFHGTAGEATKLVSMSVGSPAPREVIEVRPFDHGAIDQTRFYGPRLFELTGRIAAASELALWDAVDDLQGAMVLGSEHVLTFRRGGRAFDERSVVRVASEVDLVAQAGPRRMLQFGVSLLAADPRIFTDTLSSGSIDPTGTGEGGLTFALTFPLSFGSAQGAGLFAVNEGNIATPVVLIITGPVTNPTIRNDTTGEQITTQDFALASGDVAVIDTRDRTIRLGSSTGTLRPDLIAPATTTWFSLAPGSNTLRMTGSGMETGTTSLEAQWRSARI